VGEGSPVAHAAVQDAPRAAARPAARPAAAAAAPLVERRSPNRAMTGKKRPAAAPLAVPARTTSAAVADDQWKDF
jgi:hypothetical protein